MSASNIDSLPENQIETQIRDIKQQLSELRTLQQVGSAAINLDKTPGLSTSWTLTNNQRGTATYTLTNSQGKMLFAVPEFTFYEGSVAIGNEIGYGNARDAGYDWNCWIDWGASDGNNMVLKCWILNHSGATKSIVAICDWRFVVAPSSYSAIS